MAGGKLAFECSEEALAANPGGFTKVTTDVTTKIFGEFRAIASLPRVSQTRPNH